MKRRMNIREKAHLRYLINRKNELIDNFIGAAEEIQQQIKEVKDGTWYKEQLKGEENGEA